MLIDQHNRTVNYLRLSVTDKCNLRCFYCMPEEGIPFWKKENLLSYEELLHICRLLIEQGVNKIRITGGEPFVRKDLSYLLQELANLKDAPEISITTNATLIGPHIPLLKSIGIKSINVSLDALDSERFFAITRRDVFDTVYQNLLELIDQDFDVKVNCVVMKDKNIEELLPLAELSRDRAVNVRFLEEMPFNAQSGKRSELYWNHLKIRNYLSEHLGPLKKMPDPPNATSQNFKPKGFKGQLGIIPAFSRTFCGSCNRIRLSANGDFRTCLYGPAVLNIRDLLRQNMDDEAVMMQLKKALARKAKNGFLAEEENQQTIKDSMAHLGG